MVTQIVNWLRYEKRLACSTLAVGVDWEITECKLNGILRGALKTNLIYVPSTVQIMSKAVFNRRQYTYKQRLM